MKWNSCRVRGQKSKLSYRHIELGAVKVKRASLIAQLVKNRLAMQETLVQSLGWEVPLEKGKATHSGVLAWRNPWTA